MGNHGVRNLGCKKLSKRLKMPNNFYDVDAGGGWRFLFMDGTDMSLMIDSYSHDEAVVCFLLSFLIHLFRERSYSPMCFNLRIYSPIAPSLTLLLVVITRVIFQEYKQHNKERTLGDWNGGFGKNQKMWLRMVHPLL